MIWDIIQQTTFDNHFDDLLNLKVQTLLLDENIITEFKNLNPKLINFVQTNKEEFLSKLILYVTELPKQTDTEDRIRKFPYVSSEILAIDNEIIYKNLLQISNQNNKDYFRLLMEIFNRQEAVDNEILLGYFQKIIQNLYKCQKKKTAEKIYQHKDTLLSHLNKESVGTVLKNLLILLDTPDGVMLNQRKDILNQLLKIIIQSPNEEVRLVVSDVLSDIIMKFQTFSSGDELLETLRKTQNFDKIFQIIDSNAITQFLINYFTKGLQKISSSSAEGTYLMEIPQQHKQFLKKVIINKASLLELKQTKSFTNQSFSKVIKLDENVLGYLTLIKLSLQNGILGFLNDNDIKNLWNIVELHSTNDIIKVKVFNIFSLFFTKKDEISKSLFEKTYLKKFIDLFERNKNMFGHFLYQLWKIICKKSQFSQLNAQASPDEQQLHLNLIKYFQQSQNYENMAQKVIDRYSNRTKVTTLVVDQEDNTKTTIPKASNNEPQPIKSPSSEQKNVQKPEKSSNVFSNPFGSSFQFSKSDKPQQKQTSSKQKIKTDPFGDFGFFPTSNSSNKKIESSEKVEVQKQEKKQQKKKAPSFADFTNFLILFETLQLCRQFNIILKIILIILLDNQQIYDIIIKK